MAWWSRASKFPGKKSGKLLPAWAQEQAQVQPELEEGGSEDFETRIANIRLEKPWVAEQAVLKSKELTSRAQ